MGYAEAMRWAVQQRIQRGLYTLAVRDVVEARAWEILKPGTLNPTVGNPSAPYLGVSDIAPDASWQIHAPLGGRLLNLADPPEVIFTRWTLDDIAPVIGEAHVEAVRQLRQLYESRIFGRGILTETEEDGARKLLSVAVMPQMIATADRPQAWNETARLMKPVVDAWLDGLLAKAIAEREAAEAAVARWEFVYGLTAAVAELPKQVAETVGGAAGAAVGGVSRGLGFGGVALVVALLGGLVLWRWPSLFGRKSS